MPPVCPGEESIRPLGNARARSGGAGSARTREAGRRSLRTCHAVCWQSPGFVSCLLGTGAPKPSPRMGPTGAESEHTHTLEESSDLGPPAETGNARARDPQVSRKGSSSAYRSPASKPTEGPSHVETNGRPSNLDRQIAQKMHSENSLTEPLRLQPLISLEPSVGFEPTTY